MTNNINKKLFVGIVPGEKTGLAVATEKNYLNVSSGNISQIIDEVHGILSSTRNNDITVIIQDTRLSAHRLSGAAAKSQSSGTVAEHCKRWANELKQYNGSNIKIMFVRPNRGQMLKRAKHDSEFFKRVTGWDRQTNQHGRDAGIYLVTMVEGEGSGP